jgi:enamine deaminase RidA (YjgF/YER057c/UK114 family)
MTDRERLQFIQPADWAPAKGYSNGALVRGPTLYVAGQIGWNAKQQFETDDLGEQFAQALDNVLAVVSAAGGAPTDVAKMTVYVTDLDAYRVSTRAIGAAWRTRFGKHFPAMALVAVTGLLEPRAKVEIETIAVVGHKDAAG